MLGLVFILSTLRKIRHPLVWQAIFHGFIVNGAMERQKVSGQLQIAVVGFRSAVQSVTDYRVPESGQMATNLMFATGCYAHIQERPLAIRTAVTRNLSSLRRVIANVTTANTKAHINSETSVARSPRRAMSLYLSARFSRCAPP